MHAQFLTERMTITECVGMEKGEVGEEGGGGRGEGGGRCKVDAYI